MKFPLSWANIQANMEDMADIKAVLCEKRHVLNDKGSVYTYVEKKWKTILDPYVSKKYNIFIRYQVHIRSYVLLSITRQHPT